MPVNFHSATEGMPPFDAPGASPSFYGALLPGELNSRAGTGSVSPSRVEPFENTRQEREVVRLSYVIILALFKPSSFRLKDTETFRCCQECMILPWTMTMLYMT